MSRVSTIEIIWTLLGALGIAVTLWGVWDAVRDLRAVEEATERRSSPVEVMAQGQLFSDAMRLLIMVVVTTIGVISMFTVNSPPHRLSAIELVVFFGLLLIPLASILNAINGRVVRRRAFPVLPNGTDWEYRVAILLLTLAIVTFFAGCIAIYLEQP